MSFAFAGKSVAIQAQIYLPEIFLKKSCKNPLLVRLGVGESRNFHSALRDQGRKEEGWTGLQIKKHMARPKRLKEPVKINLMIDKDIKIKALELAAKRGISVGRLFENWVLQDLNGAQPDGGSSSEV